MSKFPKESVSVQAASRMLGVSSKRIHDLCNAGHLPAIRIPSAGRYQETLRIPLAALQEVIQRWTQPVQPTYMEYIRNQREKS